MSSRRPLRFNAGLLNKQIEIFLDFIGILFAVLIAYIFSVLPIETYREQAPNNAIIFTALFCTITVKMFLHWWSLHIDLSVADRVLNSPLKENTEKAYNFGILSRYFVFLSNRWLVHCHHKANHFMVFISDIKRMGIELVFYINSNF